MAEPDYPSAFHFCGEDREPVGPDEDFHPMYSPGPFFRTTSIAIDAIFPVAECFGRLNEVEFRRLAYPRLHYATYDGDDLSKGRVAK